MGTDNVEKKVTFSIEQRPATSEQKAAGKRLFSKLVERAIAVGAAGATAGQQEGLITNK
jgi:hypothetical protein